MPIDWEHYDPQTLTENEKEASGAWDVVRSALYHNGFKELYNRRPLRFLDIGCRKGELVRYLVSIGVSAVGLDQQVNGSWREGEPFLKADAHALPFTADSFDIVCLYGVFDFYRFRGDVEKIISEALRVAGPQGIVAVVGSGCDQPEVPAGIARYRVVFHNDFTALFSFRHSDE